MPASINYRDIAAAVTRLDVSSKKLQKELVDNLHRAGPRIEADMRAAAHTKVQRRAAGTIDVGKDSQGIAIRGGQGGGLGSALFAGGEFGGRKSKKEFYSTRSPNGRAYVVKRRVTMQFLPHLGTTGYFFWPTMRDWLPRLEKLQTETVERVMGGKP
jgi:hypothetical protein